MTFIFPTGEKHNMELLVINLDEEYSVVLGYNWLTHHNLIIDWTETKIMFRNPPKPVSTPKSERIDICLVSAQTLGKLSQELENVTFKISINESIKDPDPHQPMTA